jgi:hypothetical protein
MDTEVKYKACKRCKVVLPYCKEPPSESKFARDGSRYRAICKVCAKIVAAAKVPAVSAPAAEVKHPTVVSGDLVSSLQYLVEKLRLELSEKELLLTKVNAENAALKASIPKAPDLPQQVVPQAETPTVSALPADSAVIPVQVVVVPKGAADIPTVERPTLSNLASVWLPPLPPA